MKLKSLFLPLLAAVLLTSCEYFVKDDTNPDGSKPYVTINAPTANHSFTRANGVAVNLTVVDKDDVRDLNVKIQDLNGEAPVVDFTKHFNKNVAVIDTMVAANQLTAGTYKLLVTAQDSRTNIETKEVVFKVKD